MNQPRLRLGEILMESGLLSQQNLYRALEIQKQQHLRLGTILLQEGFVSEPHLLQALSRHLSIPWVSIWRIDIPAAALNMVPANVAEEFFLMPIYIRVEKGGEKALYVAMNDPSDSEAMRFVAATAGMDVKPMIAGPTDIASAIRYYYYGEEIESIAPLNPLTDTQGEDIVEDLSDQIELVSSEPRPIDLYASSPPEPAYDVDTQTSVIPPADNTGQPEIPAPKEKASGANETPSPALSRPSANAYFSAAGGDNASQQLSTEPATTEGGDEVYQSREAARREAERRIYGVGRKRAASGFALTLLDGTTLSFSGSKDSAAPSDLTGEDAFLAALKAVTNGEEPPDMPIERWQAYAAAALQILFRKGLFVYDEFIDEVSKIENR